MLITDKTIPANVIPINDIRAKLSVKPNPPGYLNSRRQRRKPIIGVTWHYNGPSMIHNDVNKERNHVITIDVPNHQQRLGADSLMYHFVVYSDGTIDQTRDLNIIAWHCRNYDGNESHIAIHIPIGGTQDITELQRQSLIKLTDVLGKLYNFNRFAVKGHQEWSDTFCPGENLMRHLREYRDNIKIPGEGFYKVIDDIDAANIREGPGTSFPVALKGKAKLYSGDTIDSDGITIGTAPQGLTDNRWLHLRSGLGFIHISLAVQ